MDVIITIVGTGGGGGDSELVVSHMDSSLDIYFAWVEMLVAKVLWELQERLNMLIPLKLSK